MKTTKNTLAAPSAVSLASVTAARRRAAAAAPAALPRASELQLALLDHGRLAVPVGSSGSTTCADSQLGTVASNLAYFGFAPSLEALAALRSMDERALADFWSVTEPALKRLTGDDRPMANFVVYKQFPAEVLAMSEARYWLQQLFIYLGAPDDWFSEEVPRAPLKDELKLKTLQLAEPNALVDIFMSLVGNKARWTDAQREYAALLCDALKVEQLVLADFGFKENGVWLMARALKAGSKLVVPDATDVLRLAAALSDGDVSLREAVTFRAFARSERRALVALLEDSKNLLDDFGLRAGTWKRLLSRLHPGDFKAPRVSAAYDKLYRGDYLTFNAKVEAGLRERDASVLALLEGRPGEFVRRLHKAYALFGMTAVNAFCRIVDKLQTGQLLKLRSYVATINGRQHLLYPPKGNWSRVKMVGNTKLALTGEAEQALKAAFDRVLALRMDRAFPQGVDLQVECEQVKLQTNDQELAPYGRGTVFDIPTNMRFVRTASYWQNPSIGSTWFDNGVLFFGENWEPKGAVCWNVTHQMGSAAVFSGDPSNARDLKGRGCQMIDLYLDQLQRMGVRYAVWNILCFSRVTFSDADEVLATLQWGEDAQSGKLYEPSRAQMVFPLKGKNLTKYVAYIDVAQRKLVYMDANFKGSVQSASSNLDGVAQLMPAYVEQLRSLPSVADLFVHATSGAVPVLFTDEGRQLEAGEQAYVFKSVNPANSFKQVDVASLL